ncbi:MAG: DUF5711 family protein [Thermoplasmata archaeon]
MPEAAKIWEFQTKNEVRDVAITKGGELVAAGISDGTLLLLDNQGKAIWQRDAGAPILKLKMSSNGELISIITADARVHLYDRNGNVLWKMGLKEPITSLSMNSTGSSVVIGSENMNTYVLDRSGKVLWGARMGGAVHDVCISSNGNYVVAGSDDHSIYLLDIGGKLIWSYRTEGPIRTVAISDNGDYLLASSMDKRLYFFERTGSLLWNPRNPETASCMDLSLSARNIVVGVGNEVHLLSRNGALVKRWQCRDRVLDVAISTNGEFAIVASADDHVYLMDQNGEEVWRQKRLEDATCAALTAAGDFAVAGGRDRVICYFDNNQFFSAIISQAARYLESVKNFGVAALEAEVLMQRAASELERKAYTSAVNYARGAEKVALRLKEKSRPELSILAVASESFNVDSVTKLNTIIMNTGSAHAANLKLEFSGQVAIEGNMRIPQLQTGKFVNEVYGIRPLVVATIPMKLSIHFSDMEGKEYLTEAIFSIAAGEPGRKVAFGKTQPIIQHGNIQRLVAKVQASKKEAPKTPAPTPLARVPSPGVTFTPDARCPVCGKPVRRDFLACPFCHTKFRAG